MVQLLSTRHARITSLMSIHLHIANSLVSFFGAGTFRSVT
jgi:hypothetical protein